MFHVKQADHSSGSEAHCEPKSAATEAVGEAQLLDVFGDRLGLAERYKELLATTAADWGLLGPRETERLWCRHIVNSAVVEQLIAPKATVLDVGSGAGLPGIPIALARPDLKVTLLDSLLRRCKFLQLVVDELGLHDQVQVVRARAEETTQQYDVVVCRAVAPLVKLLPWCVPLMRDGLLALKGDSGAAEIEQARDVLYQRGLSSRLLTLPTLPACPPATVVQVVRR